MGVNKSSTAEKLLELIDGLTDQQVENVYKNLQRKVANFDKIVKKSH